MLLISLYHLILSLTPPALHSLHSICTGGVLASGGVLGLFRLDVCMCQQGGEFLGDLFDFWKTCCAQGLWECIILGDCTCEREKRVHYFGRVALVRGKSFAWGVSALFLAPEFSSFSLRFHEESCFVFWSIASSRCPCLRKSICAWVSDYSWLSELCVTCLSSSLSCFFLSLL